MNVSDLMGLHNPEDDNIRTARYNEKLKDLVAFVQERTEHIEGCCVSIQQTLMPKQDQLPQYLQDINNEVSQIDQYITEIGEELYSIKTGEYK